MKTKSFKTWTLQDLHNEFGLRRISNSLVLEQWITTEQPISDDEQNQLEALRQVAFENIDYWNEEELKMNYLGSLFHLAKLYGENYRTFYDRPVSVILNDIKIHGRVDGVVANGFQTPENPYFCIHEYKQERNAARNNREGDPKGQLLAGMLAVQTLNKDNRPIFGCSILARNWYFMVLEGTNYATSDAFSSTNQESLFHIFKMLRYIKCYVEDILNANF
jgi:hypothetical protein